MQPEQQSQSHSEYIRSPRTWRHKFRDAFAGLGQSLYQQSSYTVHLTATALVILAGCFFGLDVVRWSILILCITTVLAGEMLNTAIETLAKAVTAQYDPHIARALNIASGAILVLSFGAAIIGGLIFFERAWAMFLPGHSA